MAIPEVQSAEAPRTKLPYYDLATHTEADAKNATQQYNFSGIKGSPIVESVPGILRAFTAFVSAVTDLEELAFVAKYADVEGAAPRRLLAIASVPGTSKPRSFTSDHIQFSTFATDELSSNNFDFEIEIISDDTTPVTPDAPRVSQHRSNAD